MRYRQVARYVMLSGLLMLFTTAGIATEDLTLQEAITIANDQSRRLKAADQIVKAAEYGVRAAGAEHLPTMAVSATSGKFDGDVYFSRFLPPQPCAPPSDGGTDIGPYDSNQTANLKLNQVLYAGGMIRSRKSAADIEHRIAKADLEQQQLDLSFQVTKAYYAVLLAQRAVDVAQSNLRRSEENLAVVGRLLAEQEALHADSLGAEAQLGADRQGLLVAEHNLDLARAGFNRLLARDLTSEVRLRGDLAGPEHTFDHQEIVRQALAGNPQLHRSTLGVDLAEEMARQARGVRKPKLELEAQYSWIDNELFFKGSYYGVGLNLSIPFFQDFTAGSTALAQARARKSFEQQSQAELRSAIQLQASEVAHRLQQAYGAIKVAENNLEYHREKHKITQLAFHEKFSTFGNLLEEHADLSAAELSLYTAHYQARITEAELRLVTGQR